MTPLDLPGKMPTHVVVVGECWLWTGARVSKGYGSTTDGTGRSMLAHRRSYIALVGPIPNDLTLDHLCHAKTCVNPAHLEPVTRSENSRRALLGRDTCLRGHELAGANLFLQARADGRTYRVCRTCRRGHSRASYDRANAATARPSRRRAPRFSEFAAS